MVNITKQKLKKKTKLTPTLLLAALGTFGSIFYYSSAQQSSALNNDTGNLLTVDFSKSTGSIYNAVTDSGSSILSSSMNFAGLDSDVMDTTTSTTTTTVSHEDSTTSTTSGLQPVRCEDLFKQGYRQASKKKAELEELNPNNDQINARYTQNFTSKFWISVHHETYDKTQYDSIMQLGKYNKQALSNAAVEIVQSAGGTGTARVLDVGAQVGWFTLLARGLGLEVDAFEPLPSNTFRLCESLFLNRWSNFVEKKYPGPYVNIHDVALVGGDDQDNGISMYRNGASLSTTTMTTVTQQEMITPKVTTLDQFVEGRGWTTENIALLKINTMGLEDKILSGASALLASKMVKNVLLGIDPNAAASTKAVDELLSASYKLYKWGDSNGPDQDTSGMPKDTSLLINALKYNTKDKQDKQVFLWFKL
jgi:FkbM family methyltransferase